ncbi:hypothetical protein, partial [Vibrio anguillarum]
AATDIYNRKIEAHQLLVLSETAKREKLKDYLVYLDEDMYSRIQAFETTYNDFIWKNCIGDDFKVSEEIPKVNYYTDQEMKCGEEIYSSSVDKLADILSSNSDYISS